ncbi:MAG TPA: hypothetical protein VGG14_16125 [Candidatus Sulfotelmatobacter sp.]
MTLSLRVNVSRLPLHLCGANLRAVGDLQVAPQPDVQSDGDTHYDQRAYTQNQEPPNHPHSRLGYQMGSVISGPVMTGKRCGVSARRKQTMLVQ